MVTGGEGDDDALIGDGQDNRISGGAGDDVLTGGRGRDVLSGAGRDHIVNGSFKTQDGTNRTAAWIAAEPSLMDLTFEGRIATELAGWSYVGEAAFELNVATAPGGLPIGDGDVSMDLSASFVTGESRRIYQDIAGLSGGGSYRITFEAGLNPIAQNSELTVYWNGEALLTVSNLSTAAMTTFALDVIAAGTGSGEAGANRLEFHETGLDDEAGTQLDSVRLYTLAGGSDTVDYARETGSGGVIVNLSDVDRCVGGLTVRSGRAIDTFGDTDVLIEIDNARGGAGADTLFGTDHGSRLAGNGGDDALQGGLGADILDGGAGEDTLDGGAGDDTLDGGADIDIAVFDGNRTDYDMTLGSGGALLIRDLRAGGRQGETDTVVGVERFRFADGVYGLDDFVNAAPVLTGAGGTHASTEQAPARLFTDGLTLADAELDVLAGGTGDYAGARFTIARSDGADPQDLFGLDLAGATFTRSGNALQANGRTFATVTSRGGSLTLAFAADPLQPATRALAQEVLRRITYAYGGDAPPSGLELAYDFSDGNAGQQGAGPALVAHDTIAVSVSPVNDSLILSPNARIVIAEDAAPVSLAIAPPRDPDGAVGAIRVTGLPGAKGTILLDGDAVAVDTLLTPAQLGRLTFAPTANATGPATFTYTVTDLGGGTISRSVKVQITPENDLPVLLPGFVDRTIAEDAPVSISLAKAFADADPGDTLMFTAQRANGSPLPTWLKLKGGTLVGTPRDADVGPLAIRITAFDGTASVSHVLTLTVAEDAILTAARSYSLATQPNVEELTYTGRGRFSGTGNALANVIRGGGKDDRLAGLAGDDVLDGGAGKDVLVGGSGRDELTGGSGADVFDFDTASDTAVGRRCDVVMFMQAEGDRIDLSGIDADGNGSNGDQAFTWVNARHLNAAFSKVEGQLRFAQGILMGDTDGDGEADFHIRIDGSLAAGDVIL
jgi:Ca2+-binding RTX toxin-like protein